MYSVLLHTISSSEVACCCLPPYQPYVTVFKGPAKIPSPNWLPVVLLFLVDVTTCPLYVRCRRLAASHEARIFSLEIAERLKVGDIRRGFCGFFFCEMSDVIKLCCDSLRSSCSLLTDFSLSACDRGGRRGSKALVSGLCSGGYRFVSPIAARTPRRLRNFKVHTTITRTEQPKWWERNAGPNMIDIHSTQEFLNALSEAGDSLVIVEFYGTWCASCRALFPKLCRTAAEHPDILFLKVNFDENKPMCKSLNVKVLPYFHFYRGADGLLEAFSCSLAKFQKIKDAIQTHNTARCSIGPPKGVADMNLESAPPPKETQEETSQT